MLIDWTTFNMGTSTRGFWSARLHWNGHGIDVQDLATHTGITGTQLWSDPQLTITPTSLGGTKIGMTYQQAVDSSGAQFAGGGDGMTPASGPADGAQLFVGGLSVFGASPFGRLTCITAQTAPGMTQSITTAEGFRLGDSVAALKAIYGGRLSFVPLPAGGGYNPHAGYILHGAGGNYVFVIDGASDVPTATVAGIEVGPGITNPSFC